MWTLAHSLSLSSLLFFIAVLGVMLNRLNVIVFLFFFNHTATTEIYTLSLHDALPISAAPDGRRSQGSGLVHLPQHQRRDRKSTRLNSSHQIISYAVFCLKKKKQQ